MNDSSSTYPARRGMTERTRWIWFGAISGVVFFMAVSVLLSRFFWHQRTEARLAELAEAGYPVSHDDLRRLIEEREREAELLEVNAADIYIRALAAMETGPDSGAERLPLLGSVALPDPGVPLPAEMAEEIRSFLERNAEAIGYFFEASQVEDCRFTGWFDVAGFNRVPVTQFLPGARILSLKIVSDLDQGRIDEAVATAMAMLRMSAHLRDEPYLIVAYTRMNLNRIAFEQMARILGSDELGEDALAELQEAVSVLEEEYVMAPILEEERAYRLYAPQFLSSRFISSGGPVEYFSSGRFKFHVSVLMGSRRYDYLERMEEVIAEARGPIAQRRTPTGRRVDFTEPPFSLHVESMRFASARWSTGSGLGSDRSGDGVFENEQYNLRRVRASLIAIAASRYRVRHGNYPAAVSDLVPEFLQREQIVDPFTNTPLEYALEEKGFTVTVDGEIILEFSNALP